MTFKKLLPGFFSGLTANLLALLLLTALFGLDFLMENPGMFFFSLILPGCVIGALTSWYTFRLGTAYRLIASGFWSLLSLLIFFLVLYVFSLATP